jgi:thioredoxin reductase (NADPH)
MELIHIVGDEFSTRANEIRELLDRNGIPYGFHPAGTPLANQFVETHDAGQQELPLVFLLDGTMLVNPSDAEIMDGVGESPDNLHCDVVVVGGGPAGLTAAVYAGSEGLGTLVIERHVIGGQAGASSLIRNYLGFPRGISGAELTQRAYQQAWLFGAKFVFSREATGLRLDGDTKILSLSDGREISASSVIVATGAEYRRLGVAELERFVGSSIFYTTFSEPRLMRGLDVAVVGGGNSAAQAVVHLARFARSVTLIVRGDALAGTMSDYLVQQIRSTPNVQVKYGAEVVGGEGGERLETLQVRARAGSAVETIPVRFLFVLIGALPHTDWLQGVVERDAKGFIPTGHRVDPALWSLQRQPMAFETSVPGIFAVGDVRLDSMKRVAAAVGEGAGAIQNVHQYLAQVKQQNEVAAAAAA